MYNERCFDVTVSQTLSRNSSVSTSNYDIFEDEDGLASYKIDEYTSIKSLYEEQHYSIPQLLDILKKECKHKLMNTQSQRKANYLKGIIEDCENWCVDDYEVIE